MSKNSQPDDNRDRGPVSKALTFLAYPIAALVGGWRAKGDMEDYVYDSVKDHGALNDLRGIPGEFSRDEAGVLGKMHAKGESAVKRVNQGIKVDFTAETAPIHREYKELIDKRMEMLSLKTIPEKWRKIQPHQKKQV